MDEAIKKLRLAITYAEDGAPAEAMRVALVACQLLFNEVLSRYIGAPN